MYLHSELFDQQPYKNTYDALQDLQFSVYGPRRVWFDEIGIDPYDYIMTIDRYFSPTKWLIQENLYDPEPFAFNWECYLDDCQYYHIRQVQNCFASMQQGSLSCTKKFETYFDEYLQYNVLTWWEALSQHMYEMDLYLFDEEFKKLKFSTVE